MGYGLIYLLLAKPELVYLGKLFFLLFSPPTMTCLFDNRFGIMEAPVHVPQYTKWLLAEQQAHSDIYHLYILYTCPGVPYKISHISHLLLYLSLLGSPWTE